MYIARLFQRFIDLRIYSDIPESFIVNSTTTFVQQKTKRTSMLKVCIFPKSLTKLGGIFKSINCDFFHAYDQIDI